MIFKKGGLQQTAKWLIGDAESPLDLGHFRGGQDTYHYHVAVFEYYVVLAGWLEIKVEGKHYRLESGDVLMIAPNEAHAVVETSPDLHCLVLKTPHLPTDKVEVPDPTTREE